MIQEHVHEEKIDRIRKPLLVWWQSFLGNSGFSAYIPIALVNIAIFCGSSWQVFLPITDPARYQCYALTFWLGSNATKLLPASQCDFLTVTHRQMPFHMLPLEYPPLTLLPFSVGLLAPLPYYQMAFALMMALVSFLIYWLLLRYGPRGSAVIFAIYLFLGALATAQDRFDLLPGALTLLCLIAAERRRWTAAYIALAFAVLLKLYPTLLLPILLLAEQREARRLYTPPRHLSLGELPTHLWYTLQGTSRWRWKNCLIFLGLVMSITSAFALLNFQGAVLDQLTYFMHRPVQVEATSSTFLWLAAHLGYPLQITTSFGSINIVSKLDGLVSFVGELLFIMGSVYILYAQWRNRLDMTQASIALLLVFVATGKVFSPQYLIWLIPLLAYVGAFDAFWLFTWGTASVLTTFIYTYLYMQSAEIPAYIPYVPGFVEAVTLRNACFVLVTVAYLFNWFQARWRRPLPPEARKQLEQVHTRYDEGSLVSTFYREPLAKGRF